ncbi:MAG: hypothetical protein AAF196_14465 [Planctomycetota bacterium]
MSDTQSRGEAIVDLGGHERLLASQLRRIPPGAQPRATDDTIRSNLYPEPIRPQTRLALEQSPLQARCGMTFEAKPTFESSRG